MGRPSDQLMPVETRNWIQGHVSFVGSTGLTYDAGWGAVREESGNVHWDELTTSSFTFELRVLEECTSLVWREIAGLSKVPLDAILDRNL